MHCGLLSVNNFYKYFVSNYDNEYKNFIDSVEVNKTEDKKYSS